jgi:hypothetical protein
MREGISIGVGAADRERLAAVVADRNSPQKHVWRARIILATAEGCGTAEIMRRADAVRVRRHLFAEAELLKSVRTRPLFVMHLDARMLIVGDTPGTHEGQHLRFG